MLSAFWKKLKHRYAVVAWRKNWSFSEPNEDLGAWPTEKNEFSTIIRSVDDLEVSKQLRDSAKRIPTEEEDTPVRKKRAPNKPEVEKALQSVVLKGRTLAEKIAALENVQDNEFLKTIVEKSERLRKIAVSLITDEKVAKDLITADKDLFNLLRVVNDQDFIRDFYKKTRMTNALLYLKDPKQIVDLLLSEGKGWSRGYSTIDLLIQRIQDQKILSHLGYGILKLKDKYGETGELLEGIIQQTTDRDFLVAVLKNLELDRNNNLLAIALKKVSGTPEAKEFAKLAIENESERYQQQVSSYGQNNASLMYLSLKELDDQELIFKYAKVNPKLFASLLKDEEKLKEIALERKNADLLSLIKDDAWKIQNLKNFYSYSDSDGLAHIKDNDFIKEVALSGKTVPRPSLLRLADDQDFLKAYYRKTQDHKALTLIKDESFLLKIPKKSLTRACEYITNPQVLHKYLKDIDNLSKEQEHLLIWKLRNHPELILDVMLHKRYMSREAYRYAAEKLGVKEIKALISEVLDQGGYSYKVAVVEALILPKLEDEQDYLIDLFRKLDGKHTHVADYITDEDFVVNNIDVNKITRKQFDRIKKAKHLFKIALENYTELGTLAFAKLQPMAQKNLEHLALQAKSKEVRKAAITLVTNPKVLKETLLNDSVNGSLAVKFFKKDTQTLEQAFLQAKDPNVMKKIAPAIKNQEVLKTFLLTKKGKVVNELIPSLLSRIEDENFKKDLAAHSENDELVRKIYQELASDENNHRFLIDEFLKRSDSFPQPYMYEQLYRPLFKTIAAFCNEDDLLAVMQNPQKYHAVRSLFKPTPENCRKILEQKDRLRLYSQECLSEIIYRCDESSFPILRELVVEAKSYFFELLISKLAENVDDSEEGIKNKACLEELLYSRKWDSSDVRTFKSIIPFNLDRARLVKNASLLDSLYGYDLLKAFNPTPEEAETILSGDVMALSDFVLQDLVKLAPHTFKEVFERLPKDRRGALAPLIPVSYITEENAVEVANAIITSHFAMRISQELRDRTYELGNMAVKEAFKDKVSSRVLIPEHLQEQENKRFTYRIPKHGKQIPEKMKDRVQNPKEELLRLLVQLAR